MAQSDSSDFEFDVSNLEFEAQNESPPAGDEDLPASASEDESEPAEQRVAREEIEQSIESQSDALKSVASGDVVEEHELEATFDIGALPDTFSSPEALAKVESTERAPKPARRNPAPPSYRPEDDLGAKAFDALAASGASGRGLSFEGALDDLLDEVDAFETGVGLDGLESEISQAAALAKGAIHLPHEAKAKDPAELTAADLIGKIPETAFLNPPSKGPEKKSAPALKWEVKEPVSQVEKALVPSESVAPVEESSAPEPEPESSNPQQDSRAFDGIIPSDEDLLGADAEAVEVEDGLVGELPTEETDPREVDLEFADEPAAEEPALLAEEVAESRTVDSDPELYEEALEEDAIDSDPVEDVELVADLEPMELESAAADAAQVSLEEPELEAENALDEDFGAFSGHLLEPSDEDELSLTAKEFDSLAGESEEDLSADLHLEVESEELEAASADELAVEESDLVAADDDPGLAVLDDLEPEEPLVDDLLADEQDSLVEVDDGLEPESEESVAEMASSLLADVDELMVEQELTPDDEEPEAAPAKSAAPTAEELLMRAGSLLNKEQAASGGLSIFDDDEDVVDDDDLVALPDPSSLINDANGGPVAEASGIPGLDMLGYDDDEDLEGEAMPDPASLMAAAGGAAADEGKKAAVSGNVADRAGDLPPPPPPPVELIDDDAPEADIMVEVAAQVSEQAEDADPFGADDSLDDFNIGFDEADELEDALIAEIENDLEQDGALSFSEGGGSSSAPKAEVVQVVEIIKPPLWKRLAHSLTLAAAFLLIGAAWFFSVWKQEIMEHIEGRDLDGSTIIAQIRNMSSHALNGLDDRDLYRMQWIDSEVRRVGANEIRLHARVGAQLKENLFDPVFDSYVVEKFGFDETPLYAAQNYAFENFPKQLEHMPDRPWLQLYKLATPRGKVLALRVTYRITRDDGDSDWKLAGVKVAGYNADLEWPQGSPKASFGDYAFDVNSEQFDKLLKDYREKAETFIANVETLKSSASAEAMMLAKKNAARRDQVVMSLSEGSFFKGLAMVGEDAAATEDVTMVITEVREQGGLVKGVFHIDKAADVTKHFVGSLDFVEASDGRPLGILNVTTVAFNGQTMDDLSSSFFNPGTVSRIRLKTDGFRIEGDLPDLSLRLTRNL